MKKMVSVAGLILALIGTCWTERMELDIGDDKDVEELKVFLLEKKEAMFSTEAGRSLAVHKIQQFSDARGEDADKILLAYMGVGKEMGRSVGTCARDFIETFLTFETKEVKFNGITLGREEQLKMCRWSSVVFLCGLMKGFSPSDINNDPMFLIAQDWDNYFETEIIFAIKAFTEQKNKEGK